MVYNRIVRIFSKVNRQSQTHNNKRSTVNINEHELNAMRAVLRKCMQRTAELENRVSALRRDVNRIDRRGYMRDSEVSSLEKMK